MKWEEWKARYKVEFIRRTKWDDEPAEDAACAAKERYDDEPDCDPIEAVDDELSAWGG